MQACSPGARGCPKQECSRLCCLGVVCAPVMHFSEPVLVVKDSMTVFSIEVGWVLRCWTHGYGGPSVFQLNLKSQQNYICSYLSHLSFSFSLLGKTNFTSQRFLIEVMLFVSRSSFCTKVLRSSLVLAKKSEFTEVHSFTHTLPALRQRHRTPWPPRWV